MMATLPFSKTRSILERKSFSYRRICFLQELSPIDKQSKKLHHQRSRNMCPFRKLEKVHGGLPIHQNCGCKNGILLVFLASLSKTY